MIPAAILLVILVCGNVIGWLWLVDWAERRDREAKTLVQAVELALKDEMQQRVKDREAALKKYEAELRAAAFDARRTT